MTTPLTILGRALLPLLLSLPLWAKDCPDAVLLARLQALSEVTPAELREQLREDRLLARHARSRYGAELKAPSRVGYGRQARIALAWQQLVAPIADAPLKARLARAKFDGSTLGLDDHTWTGEQLAPYLNYQGRLALAERDQAFLQRSLSNLAALELTPEVLVEAGWPSTRIQCSRALVANRLDRQWLQQHLGLGADPHHDSDHLRRLAAAVTREEIAHYYQAHRADFRQLDEVDVHLYLGDNRDDLKPQSNAPVTLKRAEAQGDVLKTLAFVTPADGKSAVIRLPDGRFGQAELLARRFKTLAADSESVAYVARQAIARQKAKAQFQALLARLKREEVP
ncbi:hypothetical protein [Gallaecimonas sp. GXIMD4217]|uniref:hypothetical protein n=1 Tax=Gallaecimonas sp. GXIMD4217 TaxID=3131927 RepID=UPI00311AFCD5